MERKGPVLDFASRAGALRQTTEKFTGKVVDTLHEYAPWLTADALTTLSAAGVVVGAYVGKIAVENNSMSMRAFAGSVVGLFAAIDGLDGEWARRYGTPSLRGKLFDVGSDRFKEGVLSLIRAEIAHTNGNTVGEYLALGVTVNNVMPSKERAEKEAEGLVVPEDGEGIWGKVGTHPGRMAIGALLTFCGDKSLKDIPGIQDRIPPHLKGIFNKIAGNVSIQTIADGLMLIANEKTANSRKNGESAYDPYAEKREKLQCIEDTEERKKQEKALDAEREKSMSEATKKAWLLAFLQGVAIGGALYVHKQMHAKEYDELETLLQSAFSRRTII